ncbi:MAG TPA: lysophospholipid acyltransferase family protein [Polyangia bacterium]
MLQRAYPAADARPTLAALRLARTGGHVFESIGRYRVDAARRERSSVVQLRGERLQRVAAELCRVHGFDVRVEGVLPSRPAILVANHVSYVDAPVLASLAPCTVIAKGEVRRWPVIGAGAAALGVLFVARGDAWSGALALRSSLRALAAGVSVLGFPEGTTSRGDDVLPFRRGLFGLARLAGVPIVPIAIHYGSPELRWFGDAWFLPHYLRTAMRPTSLVHVRVGRSIAATEANSPEDLAHRVRSSVRSMLWRVRS